MEENPQENKVVETTVMEPEVPNTGAEKPEEPEPPKESETPEAPKSRSKFVGILVAVIAVLAVAGSVVAEICLSGTETEEESKPIADAKEEEKNELAEKLQLSGSSLSDFDLEFLKLENTAENKIYSPLSIKYALAMLKDGAAGDTKTQIEALIGDYEAKSYLNSEHRSLANALFVKDLFKDNVSETYVNALKTKYAASVIYDPFEDATTINNWISDKTLNLINNLLEDKQVKDSNIALVNALAIDMNWNFQIQCEANGSDVPCKGYTVTYNHENYYDHVKYLTAAGKYESLKFNDGEDVKSTVFGVTLNNYDIIKELGEDTIRKEYTEAYNQWLADGACGAPEEEPSADKLVDEYIKELA